MIRRALLLALLWGGVARAQTPVIRIDELGTGEGPASLARAVARPHVVIRQDSSSATLPRDSVYERTVIALGRDVIVLGTVHGDVIVVAGNLFIRPGASISGHAIAYGGGVYESSLAKIGEGVRAYRTFTYDITPIDHGFALRYRSFDESHIPVFSLPGIFGIRLPSYDRTNGLSLPFSPRIILGDERVVIEPRVSYRSQLGQYDPSGDVVARVTDATILRAKVGRAAYTNESWIWHDLINSAATLLVGDDARNYYRGTRGTATLARNWAWRSSSVEPYVGGLWESMRDVRPDSFATGGPWSFHGRRDFDDMLRPNPRIDEGTIASLLFGTRLAWSDDNGMAARLRIGGEWGSLSPIRPVADSISRTFAQTTIDGALSFPTFGTQSLGFHAHALVTFTNGAPRQRWGYLGGSGTLPTINLLTRGGDQLLLLDGRYNVPLDWWKFPLVGSPVISIREILGGADVRRFPSLDQATGVRLSLNALYAEYLVDPTGPHGVFSAGISLDR